MSALAPPDLSPAADGPTVDATEVTSPPTSHGSGSPLPAAILDAARAILLDEGYRALSMRRLARRIGYSPTTIYLHYAGKDAILHALIDEGFERLNAALDAAEAAAGTGATPLAVLEAHARAYVAFGRANPERYEVMFLVHPRHMERYPATLSRRSLDRFADVLAAAHHRGVLDVPDSALTASAVWAQLHGLVAFLLTCGHDPDALADAVVSSLVRGLPRPPQR